MSVDQLSDSSGDRKVTMRAEFSDAITIQVGECSVLIRIETMGKETVCRRFILTFPATKTGNDGILLDGKQAFGDGSYGPIQWKNEGSIVDESLMKNRPSDVANDAIKILDLQERAALTASEVRDQLQIMFATT